MSYSPPLGTSADFSWFGSVTYTQPVAGEVDFSFAPTSQKVSGFYPVVFGTASALVPENYECQASGFLTTTFGAPRLALSLEVLNSDAAPIFGTTVAFGVLQSGEVDGLYPVKFGGGYAFFSPIVKYDLAARAVGFKASQIGTPSSPVDQTASARSVVASRFGAHRLGNAPVSKFGTHQHSYGLRAGPTQLTGFGAPSFAAKHAASPVGPSIFGQPRGSAGHIAASTQRTRFGRPTVWQSSHRVYGFTLHGKMGWPTCVIGEPSAEAGGFSPVAFGTPSASFVYRVLHIPPEHKFGTPLMKRVA